MTSLATQVSVFLRERPPLERGASERTCDTYALALRLFFEFGAQKLKIRSSALKLEQLDAPAGAGIPGTPGEHNAITALPRAMSVSPPFVLSCASLSIENRRPCSRSNGFELSP